MDIYETLFQSKGIRPTAIRLLVWRTMQKLDYAFSLTDLEDELDTVDKSTLFRTLTLFLHHGLLHEVDDGSGSQKYCLCHCGDAPDHDFHVHITCTHCHKTYCLKGQPVPAVPVPDGFRVEQMNYVIKGVCGHCARCCGHKDESECDCSSRKCIK